MWQKTVPTTGTNILDIATIFPGNWEAFEEILSEGHYLFSSSLSGRHIAGRTAVLCSAPTTGITAIIPPACGALGFDETLGSLMAYLDSSWTWVATWPQTHIKAYIGSDQSIPSSGSPVEFDTEIEDDLVEWNATTFKFIPLRDGFFLIDAVMSIIAIGGISVTSAIVHNDSTGNRKNYIDMVYKLISPDRTSLRNCAIVEAEAGDQIYINIIHNRIVNIIIEGGIDRSLLMIKRLS